MNEMIENELRKNVLLANYSTFHIGGTAKSLISVSRPDSLIAAIQYAKKMAEPFYVIGSGSNILFSDQGVRGLVIRLLDNTIQSVGEDLVVTAGTSLESLVRTSSELGLRGLEWAAGIPGTVGGAIRGNAGAYGGQIADSILSVDIYDCTRESRQEYSNRDCSFSYRSSIFKKNRNLVILAATFKLLLGNKDDILHTISNILEQRAKKIPTEPSIGSIFKNVADTNDIALVLSSEPRLKTRLDDNWGGKISAGYLIENANLSRERVGDAGVSALHANIIINYGKATARDVRALISRIKQGVFNKYGIHLEEEIEYVVQEEAI